MKKYFIPAIVIVVLTLLFHGLRSAFSGAIILPQVFSIGSLEVRYYGITLALAILMAYLVVYFRRQKYDLSADLADRLIFGAALGGVVGARLYHIFSSFSYYQAYPEKILQVWQGGLSIYGALFGGLVGLGIAWKLTKANKPAFASVLDWLAAGVIVGQIIGRFGNFFNYELFGYPTSLPWKMFVPEKFRPEQFDTAAYFHPLFLYEALWSGVVLLVVLFLSSKKSTVKLRPGTLFLGYIIMYNVGRFFLEFLRVDSVFIGNFRQNAIMSAVLIVIAVIGIVFQNHGKVSQNSQSDH